MANENKPRAGITKIALTGFQVFDERTELPFSKINLLFGPNSAGKSAIEDAIAIIKMLKNSGVMNGLKTKSENYFGRFGLLNERSICRENFSRK
jgi:predicted ATPase